MIETEDRYIIQKCLDGETEAFGFLVDRYRESVYALAYSKLRNRHDAEDITQKVFIKAYQKLRTLKQWDNMHAWLYSITANMCKDWIKVQSRRPDRVFIEDQDPKAIESITADSQDDPMIETLNEALESLPEIYRQVLTLYYLGGRDNKEIANFLGISPDSVRQRLTRARSLLKEEMIAMMGRTFETQRLPIGFTFRIIEAVKRIKIDPVSIGKGVPWGLSLATGLLIAVLGMNPQFMKIIQVDLTNFAISGESSVAEIGDFPVDIVKISENPFLARQEGASNGRSTLGNPLIQNALFMAPQGEGGIWAKKADMPTARTCDACEVDGKIYVIGGTPDLEVTQLSTVEEYDPKTDKWTTKADMPTPRRYISVATVNGKIYAICGSGPSAVEEYDPKTDTWVKKKSAPITGGGKAASVVNGKIYVMGSIDSTDNYEYDPINDEWTKKADMPTKRGVPRTAVVDNKIYVIGGMPAPGASTNLVEEYDPALDKWTKKADMPTPRAWHVANAINGRIYVLGGGFFWASLASTVDVYDPKTDTWTKEGDMQTPRTCLSSGVIDGKIYLIGGIDAGWQTLSSVEEYTPEGWQSVSPQGKLPTKWGEIKK